MRFIIFCFSLCIIACFSSCKDGDATVSSSSPVASTAPTTSPSITPPSSSDGGSVEHYICPNGHVGSGAAEAGTCSNCGATLEHNAAFHNTPPPADLTNQVNNVNPEAEPGTNPGVEHYICPNGHVGSGGPGAGTCANCGAELLHNDAFHNTPPPADLVAQVNNTQLPQANTTAPTTEPSGTPAGVEHYICPNGHVGFGGPGEGSCSQCQAVLVHNDAFHNSPVDGSAPLSAPAAVSSEQIIPQPSGAIPSVFQNSGGVAAPSVGAAPSIEPAQNGLGVWHYICPAGHAGGAGSETACAECGQTLVHNAAYH